MSKLNRQVTAALTSLATLAVAAPARAQDGQIEEIVVTARKRVENLQEVPDSITAFNEAMIQAGFAALKAVRDKDAAALLAAGDVLYPPCEGCHQRFHPDIVGAQ